MKKIILPTSQKKIEATKKQRNSVNHFVRDIAKEDALDKETFKLISFSK